MCIRDRLSAVFTGAGNFLTFAILVLAFVNLFLSVSGALADRKGEVGLLKACLLYTSRCV